MTDDPGVGGAADPTNFVGVAFADLAVTFTAVANVFGGEMLVYTLTATNNGPMDAPDVVLSVPLDANTTFVSLNSPAGWTATTPAVGATGTLTLTNPLLANGASATFTLTVLVPLATPAGTNLSATATIATIATDSTATNDSATAVTAVDGPSFTSAPTVMVNDLTAVFSVVVNPSTVPITWDYGDGSAPGAGAQVTHAYTAAGTYTVTVTAGTAPNTITATLTVTVAPVVVPGGTDFDLNGDGLQNALDTDSDDDGYPDFIESAPGASGVLNAGGAGVKVPLSVVKASARLSRGGTRIQVRGSLQLPTGLTVGGQNALAAVADANRIFVLDAKGKSTVETDRFFISGGLKQGVATGKRSRFQVVLERTGLEQSLLAVSPKTADGKLTRVALTLVLGGRYYQGVVPVR